MLRSTCQNPTFQACSNRGRLPEVSHTAYKSFVASAQWSRSKLHGQTDKGSGRQTAAQDINSEGSVGTVPSQDLNWVTTCYIVV